MQDQSIPYGYCECGCGQKTTISVQDHPRYGWIKGEPMRFMKGHNNRGRQIKQLRYVEEDRGYKTPCWIWQMSRKGGGYGGMQLRGRRYAAHRFYYEQRFGPVPSELVIDHLCRVHECVNPDHLEPVPHPENVRRGASTKLTKNDVLEIRRLISEGNMTQRLIAERFGVSEQLVCGIKKRRKWADI